MVYHKNNFNKKHFKHSKNPIQKTIIVVIILAIVTVAISTACSFIFNTEYKIKNKISHLASEYYENYFYPNISNNTEDSVEALRRYSDAGLAKITLRQLILSNSKISEKEKEFLYQYCNENSTNVQFFPESPYNKTSYRVEYAYYCNF